MYKYFNVGFFIDVGVGLWGTPLSGRVFFFLCASRLTENTEQT